MTFIIICFWLAVSFPPALLSQCCHPSFLSQSSTPSFSAFSRPSIHISVPQYDPILVTCCGLRCRVFVWFVLLINEIPYSTKQLLWFKYYAEKHTGCWYKPKSPVTLKNTFSHYPKIFILYFLKYKGYVIMSRLNYRAYTSSKNFTFCSYNTVVHIIYTPQIIHWSCSILERHLISPASLLGLTSERIKWHLKMNYDKFSKSQITNQS